ncbi:MAG: serine/threonine protein kinase [Chromatiales bacterium]|nr:serine/threonine protein kinase [Chromatiales bacterium]
MIDIPGYIVHEEIGAGSHARVFKATQATLGRGVALKVLDEVESLEAADVERFVLEAQILAELSHPGVVQVHDLIFGAKRHAIAIEHIDGGTLSDRITSGLSRHKTLRIVRKLALALSHLHGRGIVHRDLKPDNILFKGREPVITDFGSATRIEYAWGAEVAGSPHYMSPEQAAGEPVDGRSDLYSLGVVLFEMLAGYRPFSCANAESLAELHREAPIPKLPRRADFAQPLIDRLLAKSAVERPVSALAVAHEADRLRRQLSAAPRVVAIRPKHRPSLRMIERRRSVSQQSTA